MKKAHKLVSRAMKSKTAKRAGLMAVVAGLSATPAFAGTDTTFDSINTLLESWVVGSLGIMLALGGLVMGIIQMLRQNWGGAAIGFGVALLAATGPGIIKTIFTLPI